MRAQPTTRPREGDGSLLRRGPAAPRPRWRRALALVLATATVALVVFALLAPVAVVFAGRRSAAACLASIEAPRGPALPDCRPEIRWFALPSRLPWTYGAASALAEELGARAAVAEYVDAAVGRPDGAALARAADAVAAAEATVAAGSRRITFDELGPSCGAPSLAREAARLGDRRALLGQPDRWPDWHVRVHTLRAALAEGDLPRALAIANGYAGMDPRDEDLRTTVAAILCLGTSADAKRGAELLTLIQDDRASKRHAGMVRNWGEVRAVLVACAARAGVEPPPMPEAPEAGAADVVEVRLAQRARLAAARGDAAEAKGRAVRAIRDLLASADALDPDARGDLLAVALAEDGALDAVEAAALAWPEGDATEAAGADALAVVGAGAGAAPARPAAGAALSRSAGSLRALDWLPERGLARPVVAGSLRARAAARAAELAAAPELSPPDGDALRAAAGALALAAARELALEGDAPRAIDALDRVGALAPEAARALARSSAWTLAGDRARALDLLERADLAAASPALRAAVHLQRAELLASLGRRLDAARAAVLADEEAAAARAANADDAPPGLAGLALLEARARWTRLALAAPHGGSPLRQGGPPALLPADLSAAWPWVGFARLDAPWARGDQPAFARALAAWSAARGAPPATRRALRYAALRRRGDAPPALVPYAALAAQLLVEGEGDAEVWLDAFLALDAPRFSLRHVAFARAEAARWRGDDGSAAAWQRRYEALRAVASDPARAEIARYLGL
ncbi:MULTISPECIES: hypothetical protein [Sorangium]|uniref:Uncharacterized protein n=1 Tax=Sorangium cellulosum TaxID=56 RepID=A0A4P2QLZ6_SORCE|nr:MULTISPECIES: hypothetical protein [Sorangium]AUX31089.1 hypothetical protein SOCE836_032070 [Sorangium cellulosum]WCQ90469.1 hypothetical protein NQZ70_03173 [Sorangium sp. Soce836]